MAAAVVGGGVVIGSISWIEAGSTLGIVYGVFTVIVGGLAGGLFEASASMDPTKATAPSVVFGRDRVTFLVSLVLAIPVGLSIGFGTALARPNPLNGPHYGFGYGIGVGIACMIATGLGFASCQATWGGFTLARWWLAATGRLPLRLMTFLHDAHVNRGVLRQVGAVYQFRHAELQRRLADRPDIPLSE
jgi:hypothetical protein